MRPANDLVSIEELDKNILSLCTRINAATYELLVMIREFDERCGFLKWGLLNSAEWLAFRCDLSLVAAREKVRVAHALKDLPRVCAAFATGEVSYTKVRELTRVANADNEDALLAFALRHTAAQVADRCRELRMGDAASIDVAGRAFAKRSLRITRDASRAMMTITVDLPLDSGELLEKALDKARDEQCLDIPDLADTSWSTRQADAFVNVLQAYLSGSDDKGGSDNHLVTIHVDQSALAGETGRAAVPIESVRRLCCDGKAVVLTENEQGEPMNIGRKSRIIPQAIERVVRARDRSCCTFPGCRNHRFLHCHHVEHWSNGGETSLDNLVLLCTKHHALVHEGGFRIEKDYNDDWYFVRPDGIAVPDHGYQANDLVDEDTGEILTADTPAGAFLSKLEKQVQEPPPPAYRHLAVLH